MNQDQQILLLDCLHLIQIFKDNFIDIYVKLPPKY